ncbi:MAG: CPBP family intramembrane metalloprotease [Candidatus Marinimicrobia bacterium]|nr:CPBP family intramembrane metalloprotease [Candidatus Neomarinimicrobiota bacterium]
MKDLKTVNRTTLFLTLTFVISFSVAGIFKLLGGTYTNQLSLTVLGVIYMFIPALCTIIVKKFIHHEKLKTDLQISFKINKWFFVAWLLMPIISFLSVGISLLILPDVSFSSGMTGMLARFEPFMTPDQMDQMRSAMETLPINAVWLILIQGLIAGVTVNALAGFGEELGWRGFLLRQFKNMSFIKATLLIGFIWGIWHAPLILMGHNYPQHPIVGVFMMIIVSTLISVLLVYITIKSRSVIAAAIMHGTMNATAGISIMLINGGNDLTVGMAGLTGILAVLIVIVLLFIYDYFISKDKILINKISNYL